jgi:G:T-mismatch repair DNA endonuclease (very short patch repair protein)
MRKRVCLICGKNFEVYPSLIKKGGGNYCSKECRGIATSKRIKGKNHPNWRGGKVKRICVICGKSFDVKQNVVLKGYGFCCSRKCSGIYNAERQEGRNNPMWNGGKAKRICKNCGRIFFVKQNIIMKGEGLYCSHFCSYTAKTGKNSPFYIERIKRKCVWCGKEFEILPLVVEKGNGLFCSRSCVAKARMHNTPSKKTQPERIFEDICKKYNLPFRFTGDGSLWIARANPDFIHATRKVAIEIFGDYWHSPLLNRNIRYTATFEGRRAQLKSKGYKLIVLWETDLKREDAEAFILSTLAKNGIKV